MGLLDTIVERFSTGELTQVEIIIAAIAVLVLLWIAMKIGAFVIRIVIGFLVLALLTYIIISFL